MLMMMMACRRERWVPVLGCTLGWDEHCRVAGSNLGARQPSKRTGHAKKWQPQAIKPASQPASIPAPLYSRAPVSEYCTAVHGGPRSVSDGPSPADRVTG